MKRWTLAIPAGAAFLLWILTAARTDRPDPALGKGKGTLLPGSKVPLPEAVLGEEPAPATETVRSSGAPLGSQMPAALHRAVNSWFDFESYLSDLGRMRERMGDAGYRAAIVQVTAEFLELPADELPEFLSTVKEVLTDFRRIQRDMGAVLSGYPPDLSDRELQRIQADADAHFAPGREMALTRFDRFLDDRERHREFRAFAGTWVACSLGLDPWPP